MSAWSDSAPICVAAIPASWSLSWISPTTVTPACVTVIWDICLQVAECLDLAMEISQML